MDMGTLVVEHLEWIRKKARCYCHNREDAEDLASETISKCLGYKEDFDKVRNFRPWALAIMQNTYITWYNRRKCVLFASYGYYDLHEGSMYSDQKASVRSILSVVKECAHRSCCIKCVALFAKGYTYQEIAEIEEIPVGTVKSRLATGRKMIRLALG